MKLRAMTSRDRSGAAYMLLAAAVFLLFGQGCGKRKPPAPPHERVGQRTELLSGVQRGNQVILNWPAPIVNASRGSIQNIDRIDVYRLAEEQDAPLPLTETEFAARATLIGSVAIKPQATPGGTLTYIDSLGVLGDQLRLRYSVRFVNAQNQRAGFSNFLLIEPAGAVALPPGDLRIRVSESRLSLSWTPPPRNMDGSAPPNLLGYNVYRATGGEQSALPAPLNGALLDKPGFEDASFEFGREYTYIVRSVSLGKNGGQVESLNSEAVAAAPKDTFSPSPPANVTLAAAPGRLSIFFPANPEPDVAGYNLFRSDDPSVPLPDWTLITAVPLARTTFQDERVLPGKRYYYYVVAVDRSGNKSAPSATVSEEVP